MNPPLDVAPGGRWAGVSLCAALLLMGVAGEAHAQAEPQYPPVTSRNFDIDLFEQPALGSARLIAMAGAINSVAEGAAGLYTNPASAAIRPETHAGKFAFNVYFNSYVPASGQDVNNNGQAITAVRRSLVGAAGLLLQYDQWGLTIDGGYTAHEIAPSAGGGLGVRSLIGHVVLARTFLDDTLSLGLGARAGGLNVYTLDQHNTLFTRVGGSGEVGGVWLPRERDFRVALSVALPVVTGALKSSCDPFNCYGYILPEGATVPWSGVVGGAWRFGPTPWNHKVPGDYRDERELTVAVDLSLIGAVARGYGMEAFAAKQLQPSGRSVTPTPRLGLEGEVIPGWLRLRAGSYYEGGRFTGVSGRLHGTAGAEGRLFAFHLAGERRVSLSLAGDVASRFHNLGASLGFWN
jgi:hypothetical protein